MAGGSRAPLAELCASCCARSQPHLALQGPQAPAASALAPRVPSRAPRACTPPPRASYISLYEASKRQIYYWRLARGGSGVQEWEVRCAPARSAGSAGRQHGPWTRARGFFLARRPLALAAARLPSTRVPCRAAPQANPSHPPRPADARGRARAAGSPHEPSAAGALHLGGGAACLHDPTGLPVAARLRCTPPPASAGPQGAAPTPSAPPADPAVSQLWAFPACSALCSATASVATHPIDVVKTRLQVLSNRGGGGAGGGAEPRLTAWQVRHALVPAVQRAAAGGWARGHTPTWQA